VKTEFNVKSYWDRRYRDGRTSGAGSEGEEGTYKAKYVSEFISEHDVVSIIDWGVGDGQVLDQIQLPKHFVYYGVDVSETIINRARERFTSSYDFMTVDEFKRIIPSPRFAMALSMDVLFHFPDDDDYCRYLANLFNSAMRYVVIYSTNYDGGRTSRHVMRREFTRDVKVLHPDWNLVTIERPMKPDLASFFVYEKAA
jgi:2-polyprenyl-3-methyl-5-hydroxy-6-metoxy-1,4-benzoquinol methylase